MDQGFYRSRDLNWTIEQRRALACLGRPYRRAETHAQADMAVMQKNFSRRDGGLMVAVGTWYNRWTAHHVNFRISGRQCRPASAVRPDRPGSFPLFRTVSEIHSEASSVSLT
jgi:hypothetical protein